MVVPLVFCARFDYSWFFFSFLMIWLYAISELKQRRLSFSFCLLSSLILRCLHTSRKKMLSYFCSENNFLLWFQRENITIIVSLCSKYTVNRECISTAFLDENHYFLFYLCNFFSSCINYDLKWMPTIHYTHRERETPTHTNTHQPTKNSICLRWLNMYTGIQTNWKQQFQSKKRCRNAQIRAFVSHSVTSCFFSHRTVQIQKQNKNTQTTWKTN